MLFMQVSDFTGQGQFNEQEVWVDKRPSWLVLNCLTRGDFFFFWLTSPHLNNLTFYDIQF